MTRSAEDDFEAFCNDQAHKGLDEYGSPIDVEELCSLIVSRHAGQLAAAEARAEHWQKRCAAIEIERGRLEAELRTTQATAKIHAQKRAQAELALGTDK